MNYCVQCGSGLQPGDRFCGRCGRMVVRTPAGPPQPVRPAVQPAVYPHRPLPPAGLPGTGSHLPFLFAVGGVLALAAVIGLILFFSVGLPATLSENRLAELGLDDCRFVDEDAEDIFDEEALGYRLTGEMDARYCGYEDFHYYMYPAGDFREVFQSFVGRTFCEFDDIRANMAAARDFLGELEAAHIFQVGQYIFTAETAEGRRSLVEYFDANGPAVRAVEVQVTCLI